MSIDADKKFIREYVVTNAAVHDSQVFGELLDESNTRRDVWADSAYHSGDNLTDIDARGCREHILRKGCKHQKLTAWEKQGNWTRSKIRCRVEHVWGIQLQIAGNLIIFI
ncbi:transposase [Candidatus Latescibacterota bacterium]